MVKWTRREFGTAVVALGVASRSLASCEPGFPAWATRLQSDLDAMASRLRASLKPWSGPKRVVRPEDFGFVSGQPLATTSIQSAIDSVAKQGGGTVVLAQSGLH